MDDTISDDEPDYALEDADKLADEIKNAIPDARISRYRDYGYAVDVYLGDRAVIACQLTSRFRRGFIHKADDIVALLLNRTTA
jgi:hypothetical protein